MNRRHLLIGSMGLAAGAGLPPPPDSAAAAPRRPRMRRDGEGAAVIAADGTRLFHRSFGTGPTTLVFTASWALDSRMWDLQYAYFAARGFRCVGWDRRGHGRSELGGPDPDMDVFADDLAAMLDHLDLSNVVLVGHSMGAAEIIHFLARHGRSRVRKVVLLAPVAPFVMKTADNPDGVPLAVFERIWARMATDFPAWAEDNQTAFFTPETSVAMKQMLTRQFLETPLPVALSAHQALATTDLRRDLAAIDLPVLILHGDRDLSAPLGMTGRRLAAGIRGAALTVYPGAPHGLWITHAMAVNRDIEHFAR